MSLRAEHVSFSYGREPTLRDVSFRAEGGEVLSVLGPNGAGKSTLFKCLLGLLKPDSGRVLIDGADIAGLSARDMARRAAYIPQAETLAFGYTLLDMALMGAAARLGPFSSPGKTERALAEDALDRMGIAHLKDRLWQSVSGGERQLALIARAVVQQANIMVMDEPSSSLDPANRLRVMRTARALADGGCAVIQSTHDPDEAYRYSDKMLALKGGGVLAFGTPAETVTDETMSALYGMTVKVYSIQDDEIRTCVPVKEE